MIPSPCIGLCRVDETSGLCLGCARTRDEIAIWGQAPPAALRRIWTQLPARRLRLGLGLHRLGWRIADMRSFVLDTLRFGGGTWVSGVHGAVAEFCVGAGEPIDIAADGLSVKAQTAGGAISFYLSDDVRALAFGSAQEPAGCEIVVLAVPREGAMHLSGLGLTCLGRDAEAIRPEGRSETLYDFGLGRHAAGFGIRTACARLMGRLDRCAGQQWPEFLASIGGDILQASPTRVVRNATGRIEVFTPIPASGHLSPGGPHTHFLPAQLAMKRDLPPSLQIPEAYIACAIHYPAATATRPADEC